ncbi:sugar kinase [Agromyces sp. LHK192]|uniref:sugar kinase n=1 Tax=Agromyces sp. LHK192 TaxID=2498704 RepID=UPI001F0C6469|nr:sugar kinase [Agromyces sp. LHK192]
MTSPAAEPLVAQQTELLTIGESMALVASTSGELSEGAPLTLGVGGAESNVAIGAAALGIHATWSSRVGADPLGELVVESIRRRGVDTTHVEVDPARSTGLMVKQSAPTGSKVLYYRAGSAASALSPHSLDRLPATRVVHMSGITAALSSSARELVAQVTAGALAPAVASFDVNFRPALWPSRDDAAPVLLALAQSAHIVFVGRDEAEALWGTPTAEAIRELLPDVAHLVVKDGAIEAVEFAGLETTRLPAQVVEVVEPVGAGDAFAAGWLAAWIRGEDASARLAAGHTGAAAVLRSPFDTVEPVAEREESA